MTIKGYKSFGHNQQVLSLNTERGELILLYGKNGNGKSSLISSFEYVLYGKVRGRAKKTSTLSTLPNRINGSLCNSIVFENSEGVEVEVTRGMGPTVLNLTENGVPYTKHGKGSIDNRIMNHVGIDMQTFNSFISMSINDFKNFTSLSTEEKQLLLDKMFNLEVINQLNDILKGLNSINKKKLIAYDAEISSLEDSISSIQNSIKRTLEKEKENYTNEILSLKESMNDKKDEYQSLKDKLSKIRAKIDEIQEHFTKERDVYNNFQYELKSVEKELNLYNQGKCPTCSTEFIGAHFDEIKSLLLERESIAKSSMENSKSLLSDLKAKKEKLEKLESETDSLYKEITYFLRNTKSKVDALILKSEEQSSEESDNEAIREFNKTLKEIEEKRESTNNKRIESKDNEVYYKELSKILGENGVKKTIISNIVKPLNIYIAENIKHMGLNFEVVIDDTFTAEIKDIGEVIDHDTLSTGESKKINICIMVAYLKMIRAKKKINVLFLDEVFASVDIDGIDEILTLLKAFAYEYNISIFVVHHANMNGDIFDRVIELRKNVFSEIVEINRFEE